MVQVIEKAIKGQNEAKNGLKEPISATKTRQRPKKAYTYLKRRKNPDYEGGVKRLPFESCLITTKGSRKSAEKCAKEVHIKTRPKWFTDLMEYELDQDTGEMIPKGVYTSDDFKCSNGKKIKALDRFCNKYQPLYRSRKVTLFFLTFTRANHARLTWKIMAKLIMQYFKRLGIEVRGHIWTAEVSDLLHWHYHICIATNRVNFKESGIPIELKFDTLWGQRTEIDFVKKNVRHYMAKYFAKCNSRVIGQRSYGISRKLK
jgi:hypothetical protein